MRMKFIIFSMLLIPIVVFILSCSNDIQESDISSPMMAPMMSKTAADTSTFSREISINSPVPPQENSTSLTGEQKLRIV